MAKKQNYKRYIPRYKYLIALLISIFIVIIPFISRLKIYTINKEYLGVLPSRDGLLIDFFLYYKEVFIIIFSVFIILFFIGEHIFPDKIIKDYPLKDKNNNSILMAIGIFISLVILSSIFSKYKDIAIMGSPFDGEGALVLISYMILFMAGLNYFNNYKAIKILNNSLLILMSIIVILGCVEFIFKPIFEISWFNSMLAGKQYKELLDTMENRYFKDMLSITFYNPNYLGGVCILLFPVAFIETIKEKLIPKRILLSVISVGMFIITIATKSTGPLYILFLEVVVIIFYYRKDILECRKYIVGFIAIALTMFISINTITENKLIKVLKASLVNAPSLVSEKEKFELKDITVNKNTLTIEGKEEQLNIKIQDTSNINEIEAIDFIFTNEEGKVLNPKIQNKNISFTEEAFKNIKIVNLSYGIIVDIGYKDTMEFYVTDEGFKGVGQNGVPIELRKNHKGKLEALYSLATGRGYAWVNSLDLLKDSLIIGSGPGSFAMEFKQHDYVGLMNTHGSTKFIIDKPHNMYLQIATQIGVAALIAILVIFFIVIKRLWKIYKDKSFFGENKVFDIGFSIFIGVVGFLILAVINDSIVTVSPMFWILLGTSISILEEIRIEN